MVSKDLGSVANAKPGKDDERTLEGFRFIQGDYLDVAIYLGTAQTGAAGQAEQTVSPTTKSPEEDIEMSNAD